MFYKLLASVGVAGGDQGSAGRRTGGPGEIEGGKVAKGIVEGVEWW
jgi:hypothetical protein